MFPFWLIWLAGFSALCVTAAFLSWRECRNLALLAGAFSCNAVAFIWLPGEFWVLALVDAVMILLAIAFYCWASWWVGWMSAQAVSMLQGAEVPAFMQVMMELERLTKPAPPKDADGVDNE